MIMTVNWGIIVYCGHLVNVAYCENKLRSIDITIGI